MGYVGLRSARDTERHDKGWTRTINEVVPSANFGCQLGGTKIIARSRTKDRAADRAEQQVGRLQQYLQLQIDRMPIGLITWDTEFRVQSWNPAAERIFGFTAEEVLGKHAGDLIMPKEVQPHVSDIWRRLLEGDMTAYSINENVTKDGRTIICDWSNTPLKADGTVVGVLSMVQGIKPSASRQKEALQKANRAYRALSACNQALLHATEESALLHKVCQAIVVEAGYRWAWVGFGEEDEQKTVRLVAQAAYDEEFVETAGSTWTDSERGRGPTGAAIRTGKPSVVRDILTDPDFTPWRAWAVRRGYSSVIALPLRTNGRAFGALSIYTAEPDAFNAAEVELLSEMADDLAYGIVALRTRAERQQMEEALRNAALETLDTLSQIVEANDPYTAGHSARVTELAMAIASQMGLEEDQLAILRIAGPLHDVGKVGIPGSVLNKPTKLTQAEWLMIYAHPVVSAQTAERVAAFKDAVPVIRHHHERWDGTGYLDGLKGEQSPLLARIMAVADAFEAMTSERPYRRARSEEEALAELKNGAGSQWDPEVVRVFLEIFKGLK